MSKPAKIVILCEDSQTESFARAFLKCRKYKPREVSIEKLPNGTQSGEQWVREAFPGQLKAIRARKTATLLVFIDADNYTSDQRRAQLNEACRQQEVALLNAEDRVLIAIPKRNIETWLHYLRGDDVDETSAYSKFKPKDRAECIPLAKHLYDLCFEKQKLRDPAPPSLEETCLEYKRLEIKRSG